jgi:hypothetical protein
LAESSRQQKLLKTARKMGKYKGKTKGAKRENRWDTKIDKAELKPNNKWIAYYKAQHIVNDEDDWNEMVSY